LSNNDLIPFRGAQTGPFRTPLTTLSFSPEDSSGTSIW
jgi:hypothetical protein